MSRDLVVGWDLGGAHVKAAAILDGSLRAVWQVACPLWRSLEHLEAGLVQILARLPVTAQLHAVTMTGELVDLFQSRIEGVNRIVAAFLSCCPDTRIRIYAGRDGFVAPQRVSAQASAIASANWLASASLAASHWRDGLFVDIGSTTTDIVPMRAGRVCARGGGDYQRLCSGELIYSGVVRTPVMALASRLRFRGSWVGVMAETFATTADVYRVLGWLPEHADLLPTCDGRDKTVTDSVRRLARMIGCDLEDALPADWSALARSLSGVQLARIERACKNIAARSGLRAGAPVVGAGTGRFLVQQLAARLRRPYFEFADLFAGNGHSQPDAADCAPAVAVAWLARREQAL